MKKFTILVLCFLSLSCSPDPDDSLSQGTTSKIAINPPDWLQAEWKQVEECETLCHTLNVQSDNILIGSWGVSNVYDLLESARRIEAGLNNRVTIKELNPNTTTYELNFAFELEGKKFENSFSFTLVDEHILQFTQNSSSFLLMK